MQYLDAKSKTPKWSLFISKAKTNKQTKQQQRQKKKTAEQTSTKKKQWNLPKKIPNLQTKRGTKIRWQVGCNHNKI